MADRLNQSMPKPYVDGLVMESVHAVGNALVTEIRIPDVRVNQFDAEKIPLIQKQETGDLVQAACTTPELRALMHGHFQISRRFVDQDRRQIFELAVSEANCTPVMIR